MALCTRERHLQRNRPVELRHRQAPGRTRNRNRQRRHSLPFHRNPNPFPNRRQSFQLQRIRTLNPMKRKLLSFLISALLYAVAGYAFFVIFFKSQF